VNHSALDKVCLPVQWHAWKQFTSHDDYAEKAVLAQFLAARKAPAGACRRRGMLACTSEKKPFECHNEPSPKRAINQK
jgi:hypothetical protein